MASFYVTFSREVTCWAVVTVEAPADASPQELEDRARAKLPLAEWDLGDGGEADFQGAEPVEITSPIWKP